MAAERLHADDTTLPVLANGKTDDQPLGGCYPSAGMFCYSHDRTGEHPQIHLPGMPGILLGRRL